MRYWQDMGAPVEKLNMGIAAYGRAFQLSTLSSQVGTPASGPASAGTFTKETGILSYYEVKLATVSLCFVINSMLLIKSKNDFYEVTTVCVSSDHPVIPFNLANEKTSQYLVFLYPPNIENWC